MTPPPGFAFQHGDKSREVQCLCLYSNYHRIPRNFFRKAADVPKDWVPYGAVKWVDEIMGKQLTPDYYPDFLSSWVKRKVWKETKWPYGSRVFIKPADQHKRFTGFITTGTWKGKKRGPYWCSEVVKFINEWRYYISWGEVVAARWYSGDEVNMPVAPPLSIIWPRDYCGAVDFGTLDNGEIALVEANEPYSCGWYGTYSEMEIFSDWIINGWQYMTIYNQKKIDENKKCDILIS
jgi:hypothetical protein